MITFVLCDSSLSVLKDKFLITEENIKIAKRLQLKLHIVSFCLIDS